MVFHKLQYLHVFQLTAEPELTVTVDPSGCEIGIHSDQYFLVLFSRLTCERMNSPGKKMYSIAFPEITKDSMCSQFLIQQSVQGAHDNSRGKRPSSAHAISLMLNSEPFRYFVTFFRQRGQNEVHLYAQCIVIFTQILYLSQIGCRSSRYFPYNFVVAVVHSPVNCV